MGADILLQYNIIYKTMKREARNSLHCYQFKNNNHERNQLKEFYILCGNIFEENVLSASYKIFMEIIEVMEKYITLSVAILLIAFCVHAQQLENALIVNADSGKTTINKYIYGQFTEHLGRCIYGGIWVGKNSPIPNTRGIRNDVLDALKSIRVPIVRWPGGCFADTYHWMDGIGPAEKRPKFVNTTWGGVVEDNSFGTNEFLDFCELLGAEPYLSMNVGSGTIKEARDWVEYVNSNNDSPMANLRRRNGRSEP
jgi:alpha-N-arabinofuranosidase